MTPTELIAKWRGGVAVKSAEVVRIYNELFNEKKKQTNCNSCLNRYLRAIENELTNLN
jgi:hypothetical protein